MRLAYTHLVDELKSLLVTNREKFDYIYQSLISSRPEDNSEDEQKIRKAFYDVIRPFLKEYAYTSEGTYVPFEQVCEEEKETNVLLKDIGITDLHWIDNESRKNILSTLIKRFVFYVLLRCFKWQTWKNCPHG